MQEDSEDDAFFDSKNKNHEEQKVAQNMFFAPIKLNYHEEMKAQMDEFDINQVISARHLDMGSHLRPQPMVGPSPRARLSYRQRSSSQSQSNLQFFNFQKL